MSSHIASDTPLPSSPPLPFLFILFSMLWWSLQAVAYGASLISLLRAGSRLTSLFCRPGGDPLAASLGPLLSAPPPFSADAENNTIVDVDRLLERHAAFYRSRALGGLVAREAGAAVVEDDDDGACDVLPAGGDGYELSLRAAPAAEEGPTFPPEEHVDCAVVRPFATLRRADAAPPDAEEVQAEAEVPLFDGAAAPRVRFRLRSFSPAQFRALRRRAYGLDEGAYAAALAGRPLRAFASNSKGAARSGNYFWFTEDGAYMIKTLRRAEADRLRAVLGDYSRHMMRFGSKTLLCRMCGLYGVTMTDVVRPQGTMRWRCRWTRNPDANEHFFLVMNSVFPPETSALLRERFDLKGSTVGRACPPEIRRARGRHAVLLDLDLAREVDRGRRRRAASPPDLTDWERRGDLGLHLGPRAKHALLRQLREDVRLLEACGVMDYSLLVGAAEAPGGRAPRMPRVPGLRRLARPARVLASPAMYVGRRAGGYVARTLAAAVTRSSHRYGGGACGVDGGRLSVLHGTRKGRRTVYYVGVIDVLQPWTVRKVLERRGKGLAGYDTQAISAVPPKEYAQRFLDFLDAHLT